MTDKCDEWDFKPTNRTIEQTESGFVARDKTPQPSVEVTHTADKWVFSDGSMLLLDATIKAHISDIQVTLVDAHYEGTQKRVQYWQRTALIDWVSCHQHLLRRLQPMYGDPGYHSGMVA